MKQPRKIQDGTRPKQQSLWAGSHNDHANHSVKQEKGKERRMNAIYGPRCVESFERLPRSGLWAKTFMDLLIGTGDWYSSRCNLIWKLKGTKYNRSYFQLQVSTLRTEEIEFGLLLTPSTIDIKPDEERKQKRTEYRASIGRQWVPGSLTEQVFHQLLPTPETSQGGPQKDVKVSKDGSFYRENSKGVRFGVRMQDVVASGLLPTPAARDIKGANSMDHLEGKNGNKVSHMGQPPNYIKYHTTQDSQTSQLSVLFVSEMMGFPPDWTELPFLNGETNP